MNSRKKSPAVPGVNALIDTLGLETLVPESLVTWRPLVADGLVFFLEHLPPQRLMTMASDLFSLPEHAGPAERLTLLLTHCPTLHKLGQVVARYPSLDADLRHRLQTLESLPATAPFPAVLAAIHAELPSDGDVSGIAIENTTLAEGSVAAVVPFTWRAADGDMRQGVFKVLKPGVAEKLAEEFRILGKLGDHLARCGRRLGLPQIDYRDTLNTVRRLMANEVKLDVEQANLRAAAIFYAHDPRILVPALLPWCTPRMTAMARVHGTKVTALELSQSHGRELADTLVSALLGQPFWSDAEHAVIHADLHAGNLFLTDDGRLAVLDWSLTAALSKTQREALVAIALGGMTLDASAMCQTIATLLETDADNPALAAAVERALDRLVAQGGIPGFAWLLELFDDLALHAATGFWEDFVLLRKSWFSLAGVIGDIAAGHSPDTPLLSLGLRRLLTELPARTVAGPQARGFATHVSNAALAGLCAAPWLISLRYWTRCMQRGIDTGATA